MLKEKMGRRPVVIAATNGDDGTCDGRTEGGPSRPFFLLLLRFFLLFLLLVVGDRRLCGRMMTVSDGYAPAVVVVIAVTLL
jgi:hypothetical protein